MTLEISARTDLADLAITKASYNIEPWFDEDPVPSNNSRCRTIFEERGGITIFRHTIFKTKANCGNQEAGFGYCSVKVLPSIETEVIPVYPSEDSSVSEKITKYFDFLQGKDGITTLGEGIERANCYFVPGREEGAIPLAFPKRILEPVSWLIRKLAAKGYHLRPTYTFKLNLSDHFELMIEWQAFEKETPTEFRLQMLLAKFDPLTVKSFSPVTIRNGVFEQNTPNISELLVHAIYGSALGDNIGLPGKDSGILQNETICAAKDEKFPGLFKLWKENAKQVVFDCKKYAANTPTSELCTVPLQAQAVRTIDLANPNDNQIENTYREYCLSNHAAKSIFTAGYAIDPQIAQTILEEAGITIPAEGDLEDVFNYVGYNEDWDITPEFPVQDNIAALTAALPLQREMQALAEAFYILSELPPTETKPTSVFDGISYFE